MKKRTYKIIALMVFLLAILSLSVAAIGESPAQAKSITLNETASATFTEEEEGFAWDTDYYFSFIPTVTTDYEMTIESPIDDNVVIEARNSAGNLVGGAYYNEYTSEQYGVVKLEANKTYYFILQCMYPRTVDFIITKHNHELKTVDIEKAWIDSDSGYSGFYSLECTRCDYSKSYTIPEVKVIKLSSVKFVYDGKVKKPALTVSDIQGKLLKLGTDYSISGVVSAKDIGVYNVKVTLKGIYAGSRTLSWKIVPPTPKNLKVTRTTNSATITWDKVAGATSYIIYNKIGVKVATVKTNKAVIKKLPSGTQQIFYVCAVAKSGNKAVIGDRATIKTITLPDKIIDLYATGKKGKAVFNWTEDYGVKGYQIVMSTSKNGKYKVVKTVKSQKAYKNRSITVNKLKAGNYFFKVRSYVKYGNTTVYGNWSKPVIAKVK